ncbi:uncharacterized protein LOC131159396 [Malania oleifera]|uniref:uncharacterized protein LOC131159396 n=1 Tax=Malania oleifera TaxID=397392 RepID=UPI0025ADA1D5|nr:uncharacterized protein LOC131159396 [Malania oleifera]
MGNCQAAEAATVVIQHPGRKIQRIYWSVSAHEVMASNPGHYVSLVLTSSAGSDGVTPSKQLKLLRPDDTLVIGHVYRLISFEDVLKEFMAKKSVKLGKLLKETGGLGVEKKREAGGSNPSMRPTGHGPAQEEREVHLVGGSSSSSMGSNGRGYGVGSGRHYGYGGAGQWKPALHSIAEVIGT